MLDCLGDPMSAGATIDPSQDSMDEAKRPVHEGRQTKEPVRLVGEHVTNMLQQASYSMIGVGARHPREQAKKLFYSRDFH